MIRRSALLPLLTVAACVAVPAAASATPTQTFDAGAELLQQPKGAPWDINLVIGASFGTSDGTPVSPIRTMKMSFPAGARFNGDKFATCTLSKVNKQDCPSASKIGTGTAIALLGDSGVDAKITVYNGPGTASKRSVYMFSKALGTVNFTLLGTMRKTSGKYGYTLEIDVPPIVPELQPGGVAISEFTTTVGGSAKAKVKYKSKTRSRTERVPLMTAPASCKGGWPFAATFTYANGTSGEVNSQIPCTLLATPLMDRRIPLPIAPNA